HAPPVLVVEAPVVAIADVRLVPRDHVVLGLLHLGAPELNAAVPPEELKIEGQDEVLEGPLVDEEGVALDSFGPRAPHDRAILHRPEPALSFPALKGFPVEDGREAIGGLRGGFEKKRSYQRNDRANQQSAFHGESFPEEPFRNGASLKMGRIEDPRAAGRRQEATLASSASHE